MKNAFAILLAGAALGCCMPAMAATAEAKATYTASNDKAAADYKVASAQCDGIKGNPKDICIATAKAVRVHVRLRAELTHSV